MFHKKIRNRISFNSIKILRKRKQHNRHNLYDLHNFSMLEASSRSNVPSTSPTADFGVFTRYSSSDVIPINIEYKITCLSCRLFACSSRSYNYLYACYRSITNYVFWFLNWTLIVLSIGCHWDVQWSINDLCMTKLACAVYKDCYF